MNIYKMSYHIFSGTNSFFPEEQKITNATYELWNNVWSEVYNKNSSGFNLCAEEFKRQDIVTAILFEDEVAALHLYSFFNLNFNSHFNTKYFQFFNENFIEKLKIKDASIVMSMEYLTVNNKFRKNQLGYSIGSVISLLGLKILKLSEAHASIAPARNDLKVNKMAYDIGYTCIEKNTMQRGFQCDLIACFNGNQKASEDLNVNMAADYLWKNKTIYKSANRLLDLNKIENIKSLKVA